MSANAGGKAPQQPKENTVTALLLPQAGLRLGLSYGRPWAANALRLLRRHKRLT